MRTSHHVSIIFLVAAAGAVGVAGLVGGFTRGLERAALRAGTAADQRQQADRLLGDAGRLVEATQALTPRSTEARFALVRQALDRSMADLVHLRHEPVPVDAPAIDPAFAALETCRRLAAEPSAGVRHPEAVDELQRAASTYESRLANLSAVVAETARTAAASLTRRRQVVMLVIGLFCLGYLAVVEHVRTWTARRLVRPMEVLAEAADRVLGGNEDAAALGDDGGTRELESVSRVLTSVSETLRTRVRERTAQVERQKELLETEVRVRRRTEEALRHAAFHDRLTGLCNRDLLLDRLEQCLERARRHEGYDVGVLFIDLDRFKEVNDRQGHIVGDQLLISAAERFTGCLRDADGAVRFESGTIARLGGDEFVILLDGLKDRADASVIAERIQKCLAEPFRIQGHELKTTASIGIAYAGRTVERGEQLLRDADTAMYYAKATGKARYEVFNKRMHAAATARLHVGADLRRALENREFFLLYQPIVLLETGRLSGFEALARWQHPERGEVSPVEFIIDAEETGVIVQFGEWVLGQACRQLHAWHEKLGRSRELSISVNVSKRQIVEPGFVETVGRVIEETGLTGSNLKLEITESVVMENPDSISEVLGRLKKLGVEIHMDDFGTGYSSLSYLHRFPLDVLKIDRAFMSTLSARNNYVDVVHTVVAMARALNMRVTVEGVETQDQLAQLLTVQCDFAQGYFFSPPLDPDEAGRVIEADPDWMQPLRRTA